jgi:hypothetical protein
MLNSIGLIFSDELIASELVKVLLDEFSDIEIKALVSADNLHKIKNLFLNSCKFVDINELLNTDCLIVLTDISKIIDLLRGYEGVFIDFTGYIKNFSRNVYDIVEPINYIAKLLFQDVNNIFANVYLPLAVFGKAGIEELLTQMKNVYNFINNKKSYLGVNLPFNIIFLDRCQQPIIKSYIDYLKGVISFPTTLRLIPVMTGLIIDFIYDENNEPDVSCLELVNNQCDLIGIINEKKIVGLYNNDKNILSIAADYIDLIVRQIMYILKDEALIE